MMLNLQGKTIWQIGSGDDTRPYEDVCLKFGIAMVGPGDPGSALDPNTVPLYEERGGTDWGRKLLEIKVGDMVVLRCGRKRVVAVGEVTKAYAYSELLADIYGWDLQHFIEVDWYTPDTPIIFPTSLLGMGTLSRLNNTSALQTIVSTSFTSYAGEKQDLKLMTLPEKVEIDEVGQSLVNHGVRIQDADNVVSTIKRIIKLAKWYMDNDPQALEHEIRTFLVIPLLISLGWSEQKLKIEYNYIDIAVFQKPFKPNNKLAPYIIVETKMFQNGLFYAAGQIKGYAQSYPACNLLVVTNGYRYWIYEKINGEFEASGYLNLFDLRQWYYLDSKVYGAVQCLLKLSNY